MQNEEDAIEENKEVKYTNHEGIKYPCNQCEYKASEKGQLQIHIQSQHEGIKYPCDQCD